MTVSQSHLTMHSNISTETSLNLSSLHISYAYSQVLKYNSSLNKKNCLPKITAQIVLLINLQKEKV